MNSNCYKIIFSKRLGTLVAVGEHTTSTGKTASGQACRGVVAPYSLVGDAIDGFVGLLKLTFASVSLACLSLGSTQAQSNLPAVSSAVLPHNGVVNQGAASISTNGAQMVITQATDKASINWQSFSIGSAASVNVTQPSASSVLLNRVTGNDPSQILGKLSANGQLILLNPNGVMFGKDGSVTASAFTASTFGLSDADFMNGFYKYQRNGSTAAVVNQGTIEVSSGGFVALMGATVTNEGKIIAPQGDVVLAAAESVTLPEELIAPKQTNKANTISVRMGKRVRLELDPATINTAVNNTESGLIVTEGGQVLLQSAALSSAVSSITHSGVIDTSASQAGAVTVLTENGNIKVDGTIRSNSSGSSNGSANHGGDIIIGRDEETGALSKSTDVSSAKLESQKGFVETSGEHIIVDGIQVKAAQWLLDPTDITITSADSGMTSSGTNPITQAPNTSGTTTSTVNASTLESSLSSGTSVIVKTTNASGTGNGDITVASNIAVTGSADATLTLQAERDIVVNGNVSIARTGTNKLNVILNSDLDGNGAGAIVMNTGSSINSNGGNITLGGGTAGDGSDYARGYATATRYTGALLYGTTLTAAGGNISVKGKGNATFTNTNDMRGVDMIGAAISTTGSGNINIDGVGGNGNVSNTNVGIGMTYASTVTGSSGGTVTLTGTGTNGAYYNFGVWLSGAGSKVTSAGNVSITGTAGAATNNFSYNDGIMIQNGAEVSTTGSGNLTISGTGATSSGNYNHGVNIAGASTNVSTVNGTLSITGATGTQGNSSFAVAVGSGSQVSTGGGDISITGTGHVSGQYGYGFWIGDNYTRVRAGGNGNITINGTSTDIGSSDALGMQIRTAGSITTNNGNITLIGTSRGTTGNYNVGIGFSSLGSVVAGGVGSVTLTGTAGTSGIGSVGVSNAVVTTSGGAINITGATSSTGTSSAGIATNAALNSAGGNITLTADSYLGSGTESINAGTGTVTFKNRTAGTLINLGGSDVAGATGTRALGITDAELDVITANALVIGQTGATASGDVTVSTNINPALTKSLKILSGGNITLNANSVINTLANGNVVLNSDSDGDGSGAIVFNTGSGITSNAGNITLGGGTAGDGSGNAIGNSTNIHGINLTGATLNAGGGNISLAGQSGAVSADFASGVYMTGGGSINTSGAGNISITGTGAATGAYSQSVGVRITGASGNLSTVTGGSTGSVTIQGTGTSSATGNYEHGVMLGYATVTSTGGNVSITGTGGNSGTGGSNKGVSIETGAEVSATGSGTVTITGTGGTGTGSATPNNNNGVSHSGTGIKSETGAITITASAPDNLSYAAAIASAVTSTGNADITFTTDSISLGGTVSAGTGTVKVQNKTAGTLVTVGGATTDVRTTSPKTMVVDATELGKISAGTVVVGRNDGAGADSGNVTINATNMGALGNTSGNLTVLSGNDITVSSAITKTAGTDAKLTLTAKNGVDINAAIGSTSNKLNVDVTANGLGGSSKGITLSSSTINANSGIVNLTAYNGSSGHGITFSGTSGVNAGTYTIKGTSALGNGLYFTSSNSSFTSSVGNSLLEGTTNTSSWYGVFVYAGNTVNLTTSGTATTSLTTSTTSQNGIRIGYASAATFNTSGDVTIGSKNNSNANLFIQASTINATGSLSLLGKSSSSNGIGMQDGGGNGNTISGTSGARITLNGESSSGVGINLAINNSTNTIRTAGTGGSITLIGSSGTNTGVYTGPSSTITNTAGTISITGTSSGGSGMGINSGGGAISANGDLTMIGNAVANFGISNASALTSTTGNISLTGATSTSGATINLASGSSMTSGSSTTMTGNSSGTGVSIASASTGVIAATGGLIVDINKAGEITGNISGGTANGGGLTKLGAGTLTLSAANTMKGTSLVSAGTLTLNNLNAIQNSTLDTGASGAQQVTFGVAGTNTYNIGGLQGADALAIGLNSVSIGSNDSSTTYSGVLSGSGDFTKIGAGNLILSGQSTKTGNYNSNGGTLTLTGASNTYRSLTDLNININNGATVSIPNITQGGLIASNVIWTFGATGGGTLNINANFVNRGTNGNKFVTTGGATNTINGNINLDYATNLAGPTFEIATGTASVAGLIHTGVASNGSSTQGLTKLGAGTLILSGNNDYKGPITVSAGTLQLGNAGTTGALGANAGTVTLASGSTLQANRSDAITLSNTITGAGNLIQAGSGTLTLTGNNNYSGTTTVNAGTLQIGNGGTTGTLGTGAVTLTNNANLSFVRSADTTISNAISGTGNVSSSITGSGSDLVVSGAINLTDGLVNLAADGNVAVTAAIGTGNTSSSAVILNAGKSASAGTATGGDLSFSGSGTVTVGSGGRAMLMSGSVSGSTGLATLVGVGNSRYNSDETSNGYTQAIGTSGLYAIYRESPSLTVTLNNDSKTYNTLAYSGGNGYTVSSTVNGDTAGSMGGSIVYGGTAQNAINAGSYTITGSGLTNSITSLGYTLTYAAGTLTVGKAALVATANSGTATYNGYDQSLLGSYSVTGLLGSDTTSGFTGISSAGVTGKNAGSYTNTITVADQTNYTVSGVNGTFTIGKAALTATGNSSSVTYNAGSQSVSGFTVSGLKGSDTVSGLSGISAAGATGINAGTYSNAMTVTDQSNYTVTGVNGILTIGKAALVATANSGSATYNGNNQSISGFTVSGFQGSDTAAGLTGVSASGATGKDFGTYTNTMTVADQANYTVSGVNGTLSIGKANLTLSGTRAYDGGTSFAGAYLTASGVNNETFSLTGSGSTGNLSSKNVQNNMPLNSVTGLALGSSTNGGISTNYNALTTAGSSVSVTQKSATVSATPTTLTYNGATQQQTAETSSGFITGDSITITGNASGKNANTYTSNLVVTGSDAGNYNITLNNANLVIDKAQLIVTATQATKTYDNSLSASGSGTVGTLAGASTGNTVSDNGTQAFLDKNAGTNKTVRATGVAIKDASNADVTSNYDIVYIDNTSSVINKAALTVKANNDARFVTLSDSAGYNGVSYSGFVGGETSSVLGGNLTITRTNASTNVGAQTYTGVLVASGITSNNYDISYSNGNYTIVPAGTLLIRSANETLTYGTATPSFSTTAQYLDGSNVIHTLSRTGTGNNYTFSDSAGGSVAVQLKPYSGSSIASTSTSGNTVVGNYDIKDTNPTIVGNNFTGAPVFVGVETVNTKSVTPNATNVSKVYDGSTSMNNVVVGFTGNIPQDDLSITGNGAFSQKNVGQSLSYTISGISLSGADAGNYTLSGGSNSFTGTNGAITPATLVISSSDVSKVYDLSLIHI